MGMLTVKGGFELGNTARKGQAYGHGSACQFRVIKWDFCGCFCPNLDPNPE